MSEETATRALATIRTQLTAQGTAIADSAVLAVRTSFAAAVTRIYLIVVFIVLAGIVVTFFVPELPLRKSASGGA